MVRVVVMIAAEIDDQPVRLLREVDYETFKSLPDEERGKFLSVQVDEMMVELNQ